MQTWDYEAATIQERENAKAVQCAVDQLTTDIPDTEVTEAKVYSRIAPLTNENLHIKGTRWYMTANIHNLEDDSIAQAIPPHGSSQGHPGAVWVNLREDLLSLGRAGYYLVAGATKE